MLAIVLACTISAGGVRAQSNSEYSFRQQSAVDGQSFGNPTTPDPTPVLSMNCLAANGYGQWTLSTHAGVGSSSSTTGAAEFPIGWYLLANGLYEPSTGFISTDLTHHPQCIPPGVVQAGALPGSNSETEVTANLDGTVDYVWPDRGSPTIAPTFVVSQFNSSDVDLSLPFLSNPTPPMNVVTGSITNAIPDIPTSTTCGCIIPPCTHDVISTSPFQDEFCIASDANFLYIVWTTNTQMCVSPTTEVWATVVDLTTLTTVTGWPQRIGNGLKPTVSCDPRNNRTGTPSPAFEVAWIQVAPTNVIRRITCTAGSLGTAFSLPVTYINPITGSTKTWNSVSHARILVSSAPGVTPITAVYAIVNDEDATNALIYYRPATSSATAAAYIDGAVMASHPSPIVGAGVVMDNFITAFANPYDVNDRHDGGSTSDQFHCLYQFSPLTGSNPLLIVEGGDNGEMHPSGSTDTRLVLNQSNGTPSTLLSDPTSYAGAVNQMGIHVHWRVGAAGSGTHFYARDMNRTFDENIDENTLVTDQCAVTDGSSTGTNHGGTLSAEIKEYVAMTVWSDPNYGPPNLDATTGLYTPRDLTTLNQFVGTLNFRGTTGTTNSAGTNVLLTVGDGLACGGGDDYYICPATLTVMPYFYFNFPGTGQGVTVNANSTFNYYGLLEKHDNLGNPITASLTTPFTDGTADGNGSGTITLQGVTFDNITAILNVHGGADFYTAKNGSFVSNIGQTNVDFEAAVYPTTTGSPNALATGHLTLLGQTLLENNGGMTGNIPWNTSDPNNLVDSKQIIMTVDDGNTGYSITNPQFWATGSYVFQNSDNEGTSELRFGHANRSMTSDASCLNCVWDIFDGCSLSAIQIHVIDPPNSWAIEIQNSSFDQIRGKCIFAEDDNSLSGYSIYGSVWVDNNSFGQFAPNANNADPTTHLLNFPIYGIYFKNFDMNPIAAPDGGAFYYPPHITNNQFTYTGQWNSDINTSANIMWSNNKWTNAAIGLENTSAYVTDNTIEDNGYPVGIVLIPSSDAVPPTFSIICHNTIENMVDDENETSFDGYGIIANDLWGVISFNTITGNDFGIEMYDHNYQTRLEYNTITGNNEGALELQSGPNGASVADMSSDARNTLMNEGSDITGSESDNQTCDIALINGANVMLTDGNNNIIAAAPYSTGGCCGNEVLEANTATALGNIEGNYWGAGVAPTTSGGEHWGPHFDVDPFTWDEAHVSTSSESSLPTTVECAGMWQTKTHKGPQRPMSLADSLTCLNLFNEVTKYTKAFNWQMVYDSGKQFIETCYNDPNFDLVLPAITEAVRGLASFTDTSIFVEYRQWLESVLYLNTTDPYYFCLCVNEFGASYLSVYDTTETQTWKAQNCGLAIERWLWENDPQCDTAGLKANYRTTRMSQHEDWLNDTTVPYDTTLPTMQQLGLDTVLNKHLLLSVAKPPQGIISNASANPNPTGNGTVISFGVSKEAYVKIELFDVLGHEVSSYGYESLFEPGNKSVPLSLMGLPSGTYYARIMSAYGEVQTVKLIKE